MLQLDGTNDYVSVTSTALDLNSDDLTISFWAQGDSSLDNMSNLTVLHAQNTAGTKTIEIKYPSTGMVSFEAGDDSSTDSASSTVNVADYNTTTWVHWAFTKDSTSDEMRIYRNGVLVATASSKSQTLGTFNEIYLGARKTGATTFENHFKGKLAHIRLFGKTLSASEVADLTQNDRQRLQAYWPLDDTAVQGSNTIVTDASGNGLSGILQGTPSVITDNRFSNVLQLDGINDYVNIPATNLDLGGDNLTISFWAQGETSPGTSVDFTVLHTQNTEGTKTIEVKYPSTGSFVFEAGNANSTDTVTETGVQGDYNNASTWIHWAMTKNSNNGEMKLYRNGILVETAVSKTQDLGTFNEIYLGAKKGTDGSFSNYFQGKLAHIRIYNNALNTSQIASIIRTDEIAATTFDRLHPLEFTLLDSNGESVLQLQSNAQDLDLVVHNVSDRIIEWESNTSAPSESNYHIWVQFRPGIITNDGVITDAIGVRDTANWAIAQQNNNGLVNLYLVRKTALSLASEQELNIELTDVLADITQGTRSTRVRYVFQQMHYTGQANNSLQNSRTAHLLLTRGMVLNAPLVAYVEGSNRLLNDGAAENSLNVKIVANRTVSLTRGANADATNTSRIILAFLTDDHPAALATSDQLTAALTSPTVTIAGGSNTGTIEVDKATQTNATEWTIYLNGTGTLTLNQGDSLNLSISGLITGEDAGLTEISFIYENILHHPDHRANLVLEKAPLIFDSDNNIGIGTSTPSSKLHVAGNTSVTVFEGNVGIGTSTPSSKLHVAGNTTIGTNASEANLDIKGTFTINGNAPIQYHTHRAEAGDQTIDTELSVNDWIVTIAGFAIDNLDFPTTTIIHCQPFVQSNTWKIGIFPEEKPTTGYFVVSYLAISRKIISGERTFDTVNSTNNPLR